MATVYFGADAPITTLNGDWANVSQWYSDPGYSDDGYSAGVLLGRLPLANDNIIIYQDVLTNVGTLTANVYIQNANALKDPNATWSGVISGYNGAFLISGTFTNRCVNYYTNFYGGTFTNTFSCNAAISIIIESSNSVLSIASNVSLTADTIYIRRSNTISANISCRDLRIQRDSATNVYPSFTKDLSSAYTNCVYMEIQSFNYQHTNTSISNIFANTNPLVLGTSANKGGTLYLYNVVTDKPIIVYSNSTVNAATIVAQSNYYSQLYNFTVLGSNRRVQVSGNCTLYSTRNIPVIYNSTFKTIDSTLLPQSYGFGSNSTMGFFVSNTNLVQSPNIGANLE